MIIKGGVRSLGLLPAESPKLLKATESFRHARLQLPGCVDQSNTASTQTCVWPASYTGQVACIQTSTSPTVTQTCDASQIQIDTGQLEL